MERAGLTLIYSGFSSYRSKRKGIGNILENMVLKYGFKVLQTSSFCHKSWEWYPVFCHTEFQGSCKENKTIGNNKPHFSEL